MDGVKRMRKEILLRICGMLAVLAMLATGWAFAEAKDDARLKSDVVVLFTSDVHCGIDQGFGYAGLKAVKDQFEGEGCHVLLVDNGDSIQGEPIGLLTQGAAIIELMNQIGYDIAVPGNHEFDYGVERFLSLSETASFPYVCCNFYRDGKLIFPSYVIREYDGVKLAFVGVTTPKVLFTATPSIFRNEHGSLIYGFMQDNDGADLYAAVQSAVDDARAEGADYVILLGHLGNKDYVIPFTYAEVLHRRHRRHAGRPQPRYGQGCYEEPGWPRGHPPGLRYQAGGHRLDAHLRCGRKRRHRPIHLEQSCARAEAAGHSKRNVRGCGQRAGLAG